MTFVRYSANLNRPFPLTVQGFQVFISLEICQDFTEEVVEVEEEVVVGVEHLVDVEEEVVMVVEEVFFFVQVTSKRVEVFSHCLFCL